MLISFTSNRTSLLFRFVFCFAIRRVRGCIQNAYKMQPKKTGSFEDVASTTFSPLNRPTMVVPRSTVLFFVWASFPFRRAK